MPDLGHMSMSLILVSGLFNTIGWIAFVVGKKREEILRMVWGAGLFGTSILFADSWPKLLVSGLALSALIYFKPE
ncbi:MAG TPA: hypothetical protein VFT46_07435 [Holophagaceae bacterium]|nr:hypothetical protein [Holophagaceae bacterium]